MNFSPDSRLYRHYLQSYLATVRLEIDARADEMIAGTNWENPSSPLDWNNRGVLALIAAEQCEDIQQRFAYLRVASENLNQGTEHPLCLAHLTLLPCLIGQTDRSVEESLQILTDTFHGAFNTPETLATGLVYLPHSTIRSGNTAALLEQALLAKNGYFQALLILNQVFYLSGLTFYNHIGLRSLTIGIQLSPHSFQTHLKHGIARLLNNQIEGVLSLQHAKQLSPSSPTVLQSLYLAYKNLGKHDLAGFWLQTARQFRADSEALSWRWTELEPDSSFTYVPFEDSLVLAVEPGFSSIVTGVLLAEGDWFEHEMEFWRSQIKPGMTVIDVGANAGVYTFSAAQRVGSEGRVLAIEPFAGCTRCLTETCRVNLISWVTVCQMAANDRDGTVRLSLNGASELNQIASSDEEFLEISNCVEVQALSLDSLVEQEGVLQVDFLKIDAENHELQVLKGSDRVLTQFKPTILYENMVGGNQDNLPAADFLWTKGYRLFRYLPYIQQLAPLNSIEDLRSNLNIIAIHQSKIASF